jgi:hypothetical protein
MMAAVLTDQKLFKAITHPQVITMAILALLPALAYHVYGMYIWQVSCKVRPVSGCSRICCGILSITSNGKM